MDRNEKLVALFENEQFKVAAEAVTSAEELQKLFAEHGLEVTLDEINDLCAKVTVGAEVGELHEVDLDSVAGGLLIPSPSVSVLIRLLIKNPPKPGGSIQLPVQPPKQKPGQVR